MRSKAEGGGKKAESTRADSLLRFCLLPSAFCPLPSAFPHEPVRSRPSRAIADEGARARRLGVRFRPRAAAVRGVQLHAAAHHVVAAARAAERHGRSPRHRAARDRPRAVPRRQARPALAHNLCADRGAAEAVLRRGGDRRACATAGAIPARLHALRLVVPAEAADEGEVRVPHVPGAGCGVGGGGWEMSKSKMKSKIKNVMRSRSRSMSRKESALTHNPTLTPNHILSPTLHLTPASER